MKSGESVTAGKIEISGREQMKWDDALRYLYTHGLRNAHCVQMVEPANNPTYLMELSDAIDAALVRIRELEKDRARLDELERQREVGNLEVRWHRFATHPFNTLRQLADASLTPPSVSPVSSGEAKE